MKPLLEVGVWAPPSVLHNMSCHPQASVRRRGQDRCRRVTFDSGRFCLAPDGDGRSRVMADWCQALGLRCAADEPKAADALRRVIEDVPRLAELPPVAPAVQNAASGGLPFGDACQDPLLTLAVLARTPGSVFIRRKSPVLLPDDVRRCVTLLLPEEWAEWKEEVRS